MKLFKLDKDGGNESTVWGFFLVEIKTMFSVVFLTFKGKSREAYHTHAFNAVSWVLRGKLTEDIRDGRKQEYLPSLKPILTPRDRFHKVDSEGNTLVISFRGPWVDRWKEYRVDEDRYVTLTHGRKEV